MKAKLINSKFGRKITELQSKATPYILAASTGCAVGTAHNMGFAASDIGGIIQTVLAIVCIAGGGMYGITGGISYASAHADGDGPAQNKAIQKIVAGVALIAIGAVVKTIDFNALLGI